MSSCDFITSLNPNAVLVFGSNLAGMHGVFDTIRPYVDKSIAYAKHHPDQHFLVIRIGCGIAGLSPDEIAPFLAELSDVENISLPDDFWDEIQYS